MLGCVQVFKQLMADELKSSFASFFKTQCLLAHSLIHPFFYSVKSFVFIIL